MVWFVHLGCRWERLETPLMTTLKLFTDCSWNLFIQQQQLTEVTADQPSHTCSILTHPLDENNYSKLVYNNNHPVLYMHRGISIFGAFIYWSSNLFVLTLSQSLHCHLLFNKTSPNHMNIPYINLSHKLSTVNLICWLYLLQLLMQGWLPYSLNQMPLSISSRFGIITTPLNVLNKIVATLEYILTVAHYSSWAGWLRQLDLLRASAS